jgi:hypothetical protein
VKGLRSGGFWYGHFKDIVGYEPYERMEEEGEQVVNQQ